MWSLRNSFIPFFVWIFGIQQKSKMRERKKKKIRIWYYELKIQTSNVSMHCEREIRKEIKISGNEKTLTIPTK